LCALAYSIRLFDFLFHNPPPAKYYKRAGVFSLLKTEPPRYNKKLYRRSCPISAVVSQPVHTNSFKTNFISHWTVGIRTTLLQHPTLNTSPHLQLRLLGKSFSLFGFLFHVAPPLQYSLHHQEAKVNKPRQVLMGFGIS